MRLWMVGLAMAAACDAIPAMAEPATPLTLERVFASPAINGPAPRAVKLSPDGKLLTSLRPRADDRERFDLWALDPQTGEWRMLVDSTKFGGGAISEAEKMQRERARIGGTKGIVAYSWAPDSQSILVPLDGDLFVAGLDGAVTRLTQSAASELDATISPKGKFVSFARDQNFYLIDRATGLETVLHSNGGGTVSWGVAEFVAQEEMDRRVGAWWAPDDSHIAVARVEEKAVKVVTRAAIGADGTTVYDQRYPAAGTPNARVDLYIVKPDGTGQARADLGDDYDYYLARVDWLPSGKGLIVQRQSRDQKHLDVLRVDAATGQSEYLFSEASSTWLNLHDNLKILGDNDLIWTSERDGFSHIYRFKNGRWSDITQGKWAVRDIVGIDKGQRRIFFTANKDGATQQHVYTVSFDGGAIARLTPQGGWHGATMNETATRAIITRSSPNQPPQVWLADSAGKRLAWIEENRVDTAHPYGPYLGNHVAPVFGTIKAADGTVLQTKLIMPPSTGGMRHPVLVQVYNGPGAGRQVTEQWGGALHQYLAQQGWIVFSVDGRGSPDRGKAFEDHIYRAMGSVEVADQLAGVAWLKTQAFVDPKRIAVYGWSYGGYMTLKLLEAAPGMFAAGVSGAPVTKWELYDTHYTERYLGNPKADVAAYAKSNAIADAPNIVDPLLLIHGMADDNVVFEHSTALMAKMQTTSTQFETMVYPGQTHSVTGPKIGVHLWQTITNFLDRAIKK